MAKKYLRLLSPMLFFSSYCYISFAQNVQSQKRVGDSLANNNYNGHYLKPTALIIPGTFLLYSGLKPVVKGIQNIDDKIYNNVLNTDPVFRTNAEDYLMWVPSASIYVMDVFKVKTKHTFSEHLILDAGSILITGGIGYSMRLISRHLSSSYNSYNTKFPSGHTANAFRSAEIFHQELKDINPVLSYGGYVIATSVGVLRIYNKAHTLTQVFAGAGLGILSTKLTYLIFNKIKYTRKKEINTR